VTKEKIIQLAEALASAGYKITKFNTCSGYTPGESMVKLLLRKKFGLTRSNNEIINLSDVLFSIGFKITKYDIFCVRGKIKLTLVIWKRDS
jgi:hypothetical protein